MPEPTQATSLVILSGLIIVNTIVYYTYGTTRLTSIIILGFCLITLSFYHLFGRVKAILLRIKNYSFPITHFPLSLIIFFLTLEAALFIALFLNRTTDLMPSPWQAVEPWFFILYAITTALLFFIAIYRNVSPLIVVIFTSLHLFLTFSVTAILYPLGWGFDAFVHRATEVWIQNNGSILPKQPYYIGQYSFVVWLSNITGISIFYIDIYLVPMLAALLLPPTIIYTLQRVWNIEPGYGALLVWLIPFVPFLSLHLTTPHNLVLLLSIILVFTMLAYLKDQLHWSVPLLLSAAAAATHPLLGAPMLVFTVFAIILKKIQSLRSQIALISILILILSLLPAALFTLNNLRTSTGLPAFTNPFTHLSEFFSLLARPYWYLDQAPLAYEVLYGWQLLIVPVVVALAVVGFWFAVRNEKTNGQKVFGFHFPFSIFPTAALGFVLSAWLLRSWVVFPDVVAYEQGDFPLRILKASLIFGLPFAMYALWKIIELTKNYSKLNQIKINYKKLQKNNFNLFKFISICFISTLLMLSLYLSYPQRNIKARFPGYNITASDFKAAEWIHNRHEKYNYVVLANQLVSAAALTKYSFAKYFDTAEGPIFYYSVPTGGPQYQEYGRMLYEGQKREYMEAAMERAGVKTGYFAINKYWANSDKIIEGAKKSADSWQVIDDGKVWVFVYNK